MSDHDTPLTLCSRTKAKMLDEGVHEIPVGHGLVHRLHLGARGYRLGKLVVRILSGLHGGWCPLCCLGEDCLVGNLDVLLWMLLPGLPSVATGTGSILAFEHVTMNRVS